MRNFFEKFFLYAFELAVFVLCIQLLSLAWGVLKVFGGEPWNAYPNFFKDLGWMVVGVAVSGTLRLITMRRP